MSVQRTDEFVKQLWDEELCSKLDGSSLLDDEPLDEKEAKKLFRQVCVKREGKAPTRRRSRKKFVAILLAAAIFISCLSVFATEFVKQQMENIRVHSAFMSVNTNWDNLDMIVYPEASTEGNGVTIRTDKAFSDGVHTWVVFEVVTPDNGARLEGTGGMSGFKRIEPYDGGETGASWTMDRVEDPDPSDNIVYLRGIYQKSRSEFLLRKKLKMLFAFEDLTYFDADGNQQDIDGSWLLNWEMPNLPAEHAVDIPIQPVEYEEGQTLFAVQVSPMWLTVEVRFDDVFWGEGNSDIAIPVIRFKDGTIFNSNYPMTIYHNNGLEPGATLYVSFAEPLDLSRVEAIQIGGTTIPVTIRYTESSNQS